MSLGPFNDPPVQDLVDDTPDLGHILGGHQVLSLLFHLPINRLHLHLVLHQPLEVVQVRDAFLDVGGRG